MNGERTPIIDETAIANLEAVVNDPSQFPPPRATTGTMDDEDAPGDEHDGENEASVRETSDEMEAPEEFERQAASTGSTLRRARRIAQNDFG